MALYKIERFKDEITNNHAISDDVKKGFEAVRRMSNNFTILNEAAKQHDETVYLALLDELGQSSGESIVKQFRELFASLKQNDKNQQTAEPVSEKAVLEIVERHLKNKQIGIDDLSPSLKKFIAEAKVVK